jgi:hypothetical protein
MPYRICKTFEIENGHMLSKHPDKCRFPHGHTRKVEFTLEADALAKVTASCALKKRTRTRPGSVASMRPKPCAAFFTMNPIMECGQTPQNGNWARNWGIGQDVHTVLNAHSEHRAVDGASISMTFWTFALAFWETARQNAKTPLSIFRPPLPDLYRHDVQDFRLPECS